MKEKVEKINSLIKAFESRNELLHEEIERNEDAIKEMKKELLQYDDNLLSIKADDSKLKVVL
ncbi:MAG TPA: hypothetical protein PLB45_02510 [Bacilli bacterium]|jgi:predicted RNase H-like nuclease (RuvC/YqgF family)|nr:hypothetical protein [Bacilli bacterium]HPZ24268.1 hypothetical protein [Bacilli bacterium]HQC83729.1 hypothetical protein [Bacilli bacterium]